MQDMEKAPKKKRLVWQGDMEQKKVDSYEKARGLLAEVGTTARGAEIMADKMLFHVVKLTDVDTRAANILKQSLLSKGADVAVSAATVNLAAEKTDVVIFATAYQLKPVIERLKEQPWGLKDIAVKLESLLAK